MIRKTLCALVAGTILGCSGGASKGNEPKYETITGLPISVGEFYDHGYGSIATVIVGAEGKIILAEYGGRLNTKTAARAQALIQSEINDGDNDEIELYGYYQADGTFKMQSLEANGYKVEF